MPSTDFRTNLKLAADLIHRGTARVLLIGDSQFAHIGTDRISQAMGRVWAPLLGHAGRWVPASGSGNLAALIHNGLICQGVSVSGASTFAQRDANETLNAVVDLPIGINGDWLWDGATPDTSDIEMCRMLLGTETDDPAIDYKYAGPDPYWYKNNKLIARTIYHAAAANALAGWRARAARYDEVSGGGGGIGFGSAVEVATGAAGVNSFDTAVPVALVSRTGAGGVFIYTSTPLTELANDKFGIFGSQIFKDDNSGGIADGFALMGLIGAGGMTTVDHDVSPTGWMIDDGIRGIIKESPKPPNIVIIMLGNNLVAPAETTDPAGLDGTGLNFKTNYETVISRIRGHYSALSLPDPLFLLLTPWASGGAWDVARAAVGRDQIHSLATAGGAGYGVINNYDIHGGVIPTALLDGGQVHPKDDASADSLMSSIWSQITKASTKDLLTAVSSHIMLREASGNRVDEIPESGNTVSDRGNGTDPGNTDGILGKALLMAAGNSALSIADASTVGLRPLPGTDFTITIWFSPTSFLSGTLLRKSGTNIGYRIYSDLSGTGRIIGYVGGGGSTGQPVVSGLSAGKTYFVALLHEHGVNQTVKVYEVGTGLIGMATSGVPMTAQAADSTEDFMIGAANIHGISRVDGWLSDFDMCHRLRTDAELEKLSRGIPFSRYGGKNITPVLLAMEN